MPRGRCLGPVQVVVGEAGGEEGACRHAYIGLGQVQQALPRLPEHGERLRVLPSRVHGRAEEEQGQGLAAPVPGTPVEFEAVPVGVHRAGRVAAVEVAAVELLDGRAQQQAVGGLGEGHGALEFGAGAVVLAASPGWAWAGCGAGGRGAGGRGARGRARACRPARGVHRPASGRCGRSPARRVGRRAHAQAQPERDAADLVLLVAEREKPPAFEAGPSAVEHDGLAMVPAVQQAAEAPRLGRSDADGVGPVGFDVPALAEQRLAVPDHGWRCWTARSPPPCSRRAGCCRPAPDRPASPTP